MEKRQLFKCLSNIPSCLWRLLKIEICGMLILCLKLDWPIRIIDQIRGPTVFYLFQAAEGQIDNLQPLVEHLLKESKLLANREGARGDHIHQTLLDLSSRWLKACDEVEKQKKAVRIVPNWYQFRSNMDDIDAWLKKMEQDKGLSVEVRTGSTLVPRLYSAVFKLLYKRKPSTTRQEI